MAENRVRILMAKPGLEGHWLGLMTVSKALRDAGFEVTYGGGNMSPADIAATAVQEDVGVVGLSILTANYVKLTSLTIEELKKRGKGDVLVLLGGMIYEEDFPALEEMGVGGMFVPGTPLEEIVAFVREKTSGVGQRAG